MGPCFEQSVGHVMDCGENMAVVEKKPGRNLKKSPLTDDAAFVQAGRENRRQQSFGRVAGSTQVNFGVGGLSSRPQQVLNGQDCGGERVVLSPVQGSPPS